MAFRFFFINADFIVPTIFTVLLPMLLVSYYFIKNWKKSFELALYTGLIFATIFTLSTFIPSIDSFILGMEGIMHAIIVSVVTGISAYVALMWHNMKNDKLLYYVAGAVLIVELALPYITTSIPLMSFA